jgi:hypothetical protein
MGVFNLLAPPTVTETTTSTQMTDDNGNIYYEFDNVYNIDANGFFNSVVVFNPAVVNSSPTGATIQNKKVQIVLINPAPTPSQIGSDGVETVGTYTAYVGSAIGTTYIEPKRQPSNNSHIAVRVSFDVVPNNGTPKSTIVKTFWASVQ